MGRVERGGWCSSLPTRRPREEAGMPNPASIGRARPVGQPEQPAGPNERRAAILEMVMAAGSVKIEDLPDAFGVSLMTVHRDLDTLVAQGLIRKTRGCGDRPAEHPLGSQHRVPRAAECRGQIRPGECGPADDRARPIGDHRRLHHWAEPGQPARRTPATHCHHELPVGARPTGQPARPERDRAGRAVLSLVPRVHGVIDNQRVAQHPRRRRRSCPPRQ